jgi:peptide/nickel transport system substrate-binding protein
VALSAAAACSQQSNGGGDTLRVGFNTEPRSLNPIMESNGQEMVIDRLFSDPLTSFDAGGNRVVPILASAVPSVRNGGVSADGMTIIFRLRRGVRWQDGAPFTSSDVAYSFRQVMNPNNDVVSRFGYDDIATLDTPDAYTVRLRLKRPFSPIVTTFFGDANIPYGILPRHLLAKYASLNAVPFDALPIGTGPFRVTAWRRGDRLELDANPDYFRGRAHVAHVTVLFAHDEQTLITMASAREIDWAAELSPASIGAARAIRGYRVVLVAQNRWFGITFNMTHPAVQDIRVRRAVELAVDKRALARTLTGGTALPATQDLPSFLWASPRLPASPYDPAAARALLAQAGYTPERPLRLQAVYNVGDATARKLAVVLQRSLAPVGISLDPKGYSSELLTAQASLGGILSGGRFDIALARIINGPEPDNSAEYSCAGAPPNGFNFAHYCNAEMERLQRIATTSYDLTVRRDAYRDIETLLERDLPQIPLWWPRDVHVVSDRLQHFDPNPFVETWDIASWRLAP